MRLNRCLPIHRLYFDRIACSRHPVSRTLLCEFTFGGTHGDVACNTNALSSLSSRFDRRRCLLRPAYADCPVGPSPRRLSDKGCAPGHLRGPPGHLCGHAGDGNSSPTRPLGPAGRLVAAGHPYAATAHVRLSAGHLRGPSCDLRRPTDICERATCLAAVSTALRLLLSPGILPVPTGQLCISARQLRGPMR
jgi:hypothetical protein